MNIRYLREFLIFNNNMNFTAAAKKLFISQPALSNHIAALEKEIGADLVKHGRSLTLTPAGRVLVNEAPKLIALHDQIMEKCALAEVEGGTLCIARNHGTRSCNEDNFDILLASFANDHPNIYIRDIVWDESNAFPTLKQQDVDLVSVNYIPPRADVEDGVRFVEAPNYVRGHFCLWVDKSNPLAKDPQISWSDVDALTIPFSLNQDLTESNIKDLCDELGIDLEYRHTPEFGWSYLRSFNEVDSLILDSGFLGYETFRMFPNRRLIDVVGERSECVLHLGYLEENDNPALRIFLSYIAEQQGNPSYRPQ